MLARTKLMIVDDSAAARAMLVRGLGRVADLEVAGTAANGRAALDLLDAISPDVVVLDIEMPEMDGLTALEAMKAARPELPVIMFSALTVRGATTTFEALSRGAADYVAKPVSGGASLDAWLLTELVPKIRALAGRNAGTGEPVRLSTGLPRQADIVAVGASTGGPSAVESLVEGLPPAMNAPVVVVQHMPAVFTQLFAARLGGRTRLTVREAQGGEVLRPGEVWIAPGDRHLKVLRKNGVVSLEATKDPPVSGCRPSVDVLFRSVADAFGAGALGVVLTGMGQDGLAGAHALHKAGGRVLVQDEATSTVWGMAGHVARAGLAHSVLPLGDLVHEIACAVRSR